MSDQTQAWQERGNRVKYLGGQKGAKIQNGEGYLGIIRGGQKRNNLGRLL